MHGFAYAANLNSRLLLSTPTAATLTEDSAIYNVDIFSLGFRVTATAGTIWHLTKSTDAAVDYARIVIKNEKLYWSDDTNGNLYLCDILPGGLYHVWLDVTATAIGVYCTGDGQTGTYSSVGKSAMTPTSGRVTFFNNRAATDPLTGTAYDFAFVSGGAADNGIFRPGGINTFGWTRFYPFRAGLGNTVTCVVSGTVLSGSITWGTGDTDHGLRWA